MKTLFLALILASACGTDKKPKSGNTSNPDTSTNPADTARSTAPEKSGSPMSFSVASASKLPPCTNGHLSEVVYVTDEKKLYACDGTKWNLAEIVQAAPTHGASSTTTCGGPAAPFANLTLDYSATILETGDIWARAAVNNSLTYSNTQYYGVSQPGAAAATVTILDGGSWVFSLSNSKLTVNYTDTSSKAYSWQFDCSVKTF